MISTTLFPGRYAQGAGALSRLGAELARLGARHLVIASPLPAEHLLPDPGLADPTNVDAEGKPGDGPATILLVMMGL